jgi:hypothetical protein
MFMLLVAVVVLMVGQVYQGRNLETIDLKRTARSGAAGFIGHGPLCHYWMLFMETYLDFGGAWWGTGVKVLGAAVKLPKHIIARPHVSFLPKRYFKCYRELSCDKEK